MHFSERLIDVDIQRQIHNDASGLVNDLEYPYSDDQR